MRVLRVFHPTNGSYGTKERKIFLFLYFAIVVYLLYGFYNSKRILEHRIEGNGRLNETVVLGSRNETCTNCEVALKASVASTNGSRVKRGIGSAMAQLFGRFGRAGAKAKHTLPATDAGRKASQFQTIQRVPPAQEAIRSSNQFQTAHRIQQLPPAQEAIRTSNQFQTAHRIERLPSSPNAQKTSQFSHQSTNVHRTQRHHPEHGSKTVGQSKGASSQKGMKKTSDPDVNKLAGIDAANVRKHPDGGPHLPGGKSDNMLSMFNQRNRRPSRDIGNTGKNLPDIKKVSSAALSTLNLAAYILYMLIGILIALLMYALKVVHACLSFSRRRQRQNDIEMEIQ